MAFFLISPDLYNWVILPALIFVAQIANVCMETLRIVFLSKGIKYLAAIIAFFEITIWLLAIVGVISNLSNIANFFAYAFGFALGTYVGLEIEERLSIGMVIMRIITTNETSAGISRVFTDRTARYYRSRCPGCAGRGYDDYLSGES